MAVPGTAVIAESLEKTYYRGSFLTRAPAVKALRGLSFRVEKGEIYGLLGPNGAGKTTTVKIISTLMVPDKGEAYVLGYNVVDEFAEVRKRIGVMLSVERGFFWKLTGRENLRYFGLLYGLSGRDLEDRIDRAIDTVGLKELEGDEKFFEDMSLGMRARLGLARVLLKDPEIMILDEPTLGLDPHSARHIRRLLRLEARNGKTVLVTTHNMFEAEILCDRVGIIRSGKIIAEGAPEELKSFVSKSTPVTVLLKSFEEPVVQDLVARLSRDDVKVDYERVEPGKWKISLLVPRGFEDEVLADVYVKARSLGVSVMETKVREVTLEDVFIALTGGKVEG
ncbi:MAG: ABC transporter ATP-binding protein [Desulfurococcales archaeon]|nr:ABC transporter ATP-binding protein [Desulfurococcales archaeon]